jgi:3-dehydroquinate synthase
MPALRVDLADRSYPVFVENGLLGRAAETLSGLEISFRKVAVVSDETVASFHAPALMSALASASLQATLHTVPAGESSKSMSRAEVLCREMAAAGHDRKSLVIALGGGVVGDLAGFAAAIFYRGIPFIQIPTTIVAQVDSSVGGKTGVNIAEGKNLLGCFHQPRAVLVDPETLRTLPDREFHEGFAEAIKHAAIRDAAMLDDLAALHPSSREVPAGLIARNIAIKARIVEQDEHETLGLRALLNFGHTIGHGIEAAVPYGQILHGEAIALGMRAALVLSEKHGGITPTESQRVLKLLQHFHLPLLLPPEITTEVVLEKLSRDKKFTAGGIRFVVLQQLGDAAITDKVTRGDLAAAIEALRSPLG